MRSTSRAGAGQEALWDGSSAPGGVTVEPVAARPAASPRRGAASAGEPSVERTWTLQGSEFARRGWHAGTVLHVTPASRAARGDLVVVRDGPRLLLGVLGLDRGRPALLTDVGSTWLAERARVVGVVSAVQASLTS